MSTSSSVRIPTSNHALLCSVGKNHENEVRYHPFRMTPYLVKVPGQQGAENQLCCVLLAERVHSGYEGNSQAQARAQALAGPSLLPWFRHSVCKVDSSPACPPALGRVSISLETAGTATFVSWASLEPLPRPLLMQLGVCPASLTHVQAITVTPGAFTLPWPLPTVHVVRRALTVQGPGPAQPYAPPGLSPSGPLGSAQNPKPPAPLGNKMQGILPSLPWPIVPPLGSPTLPTHTPVFPPAVPSHFPCPSACSNAVITQVLLTRYPLQVLPAPQATLPSVKPQIWVLPLKPKGPKALCPPNGILRATPPTKLPCDTVLVLASRSSPWQLRQSHNFRIL